MSLDTDDDNKEIVSEKDLYMDGLLKEFKENRDALHKMLIDIEDVKNNIEKLFPQKLDSRYSQFFESKVKAAFSIFSTLLEIRKEISKSLKDEIELRNKYSKGKEDFSDMVDIRELSEKVERLKNLKMVS